MIIFSLFWACKQPIDNDPPPDPYAGMTRHDIPVAGGTIEDESGFTITVPEAAIAADTAMYLRTLSADQTPIASARSTDLLFALHGEVVPASGTFEGFAVPIVLSIPAPTLEPGDFVMIREFDPATRRYLPSTRSYTIDYTAKTIELDVHHFSAITAEVIAELKRAKEECSDPATSCRCSRVRVESDNDDHMCVIDGVASQVLRDYVEVQFLDCPGSPTESASLSQISPTAIPKMTLTATELLVEPGDTVDLEALFQLGCAPFKTKNVTFSLTGPGTLQKTNEVTDTQGIAQNRMTATVTIQVIEKPVMTLVVEPERLTHGATATVVATLTVNGEAIPDQIVSFSVSGPAALSAGSAITDASGIATTSVTAGNRDGSAEITALTTVQVEADSGPIDLVVTASCTVVVHESTESGMLLADNSISTAETTTLTVTLLNNGEPVVDQIIFFATLDSTGNEIWSTINFFPGSVVHTDTQGRATVVVCPLFDEDDLPRGGVETVTIRSSSNYYDEMTQDIKNYQFEEYLTVTDEVWEGVVEATQLKEFPEFDICRLTPFYVKVQSDVTVSFVFSHRISSYYDSIPPVANYSVVHREASAVTSSITCTPQPSGLCEPDNGYYDYDVVRTQYATFIPSVPVVLRFVCRLNDNNEFDEMEFLQTEAAAYVDPNSPSFGSVTSSIEYEHSGTYHTKPKWLAICSDCYYQLDGETYAGRQRVRFVGLNVLNPDYLDSNLTIPIAEGSYSGSSTKEGYGEGSRSSPGEHIDFTVTLSRVQ